MQELRRGRRGASGALRKRATGHTARAALLLVVFATVCIFLFTRLMDIGTWGAGREEHNAGEAMRVGPTNHFFTRVSFVMDDSMAHAWRTSSERLTFQVQLRVERVQASLMHGGEQQESTAEQSAKVSATLYGKSSLKLKHTRRRSLYIRTDVPIEFVSSNASDATATHVNDAPVALKEFLLLSLWEDTYRIAYRTSVDLLRQFDLLFSYAQLVELRCYPAVPSHAWDHPCAPSVSGTSVSDGAQHGRTLGVYLAMEPPAQAIWRRMKAAFAALEAEEGGGSPPDAAAAASALSRREYETKAEHVARIDHWRRMWRITKESYGGNVESAVEVGSRNFMNFREPRHDLSHVPSYKKNSSFMPSYRLLEKNPLRYGLMRGMTSADEREAAKQFFDLPQYMAWIAINTILRNSDYDDEVLFYGVLRRSASPHDGMPQLRPPLPVHLGLMGWDYDSIFANCHRKLWFSTPLMFCAETTLDHNILTTPRLLARYTEVLWDLLQRVDERRFRHSVGFAERELGTIFHAAPGTLLATYGKDRYEEDTGVKWIMESFMAQRKMILRAVEPYIGRSSALSSEAPASVGTAGVANLSGLGQVNGGTTEARRELLSRLSHTVKVARSRVVVAHGYTVKSVQSALGQPIQRQQQQQEQDQGEWEGETYILPAPGMYCARVDVPTEVLMGPGQLGGIAAQLKQEGRSSLLVDVPLVEPSPSRSGAEYGLWLYKKPDPMQHAMTAPAEGADLHVVVPPVWPTSSSGSRGVFVARVLRPNQDSKPPSFTWTRKNTLLAATDATSLKTMIVRGFSAVRFVVVPAATNDMSSLAPRHERENAADGPLLFIRGGGGMTEVVVPGTGVRRLAPLTSVLPPPRSPSATNGLVDADGTALGEVLEGGQTLICSATAASVGGPTVRTVKCPVFVRGVFAVGRGATLEVTAGCVVVLLPGALLRVEGSARLNGTAAAPVVVTGEDSVSSSSNWRTIHVDGPDAALNATFTFFTGSGVKGMRVPGTGKHHSHSAAITLTNRALLSLRHSFLLELRGAAIAAGTHAVVQVADSLVQWAQMGVECLRCGFVSQRSVWSHFPAWDTAYADDDNDAMYLSGGEHRVTDSVIAHTKDDGIDSGAVAGGRSNNKISGGSLVVHNTIIEACMHEGVALSTERGVQRVVVVAHTVLQHCQQCVESGYTAGLHTAAVTSCLIQHCAVGVRYGDNYHWSHCDGEMMVHNTTIAHNEANAMNYERRKAAPKGPSQFHTQEMLPQQHWQLLQDAASSSALPLSAPVSAAAGVVSLMPDARAKMSSMRDWQGCGDIFALPGNSSTKKLAQTDTGMVMEDNYLRDITLHF
ncbi:hypothetical protein DQ04_03471030 [Trypanosoma grayi]|uniref:hypothetical protein n=1 Tax=Trypanosoma grayi TaxID=71804 RepID=UPI0004F48098|nr:hypothetical protein DQ04_03471030 [Trypanosoma grayi]KEG10643.1 hypothetical protein DQ04_03471030 [Trypanosoma grayi]